jgi:CheY-like chemotaxis protein
MKEYNILIAEDSPTTSEYLKDTLEKLGYRISNIVTSGNEILENIKKDIPDIILMDIELEGSMNGVDAAELIKQSYNIPIIYLTSHDEDEILKRARITDPSAYILKPFKIRELEINISFAIYKNEADKKYKLLKKNFVSEETAKNVAVRNEKDSIELYNSTLNSLIEALYVILLNIKKYLLPENQ